MKKLDEMVFCKDCELWRYWQDKSIKGGYCLIKLASNRTLLSIEKNTKDSPMNKACCNFVKK